MGVDVSLLVVYIHTISQYHFREDSTLNHMHEQKQFFFGFIQLILYALFGENITVLGSRQVFDERIS